MTETIELRIKPELKIVLNAKSFEIVDVYDSQNSGIYSYSELKNVKIYKKRTNWLITGLILIVGLFTGFAGGRFKNKANLIFEMKNRRLKIRLFDTDFEKVKRVIELISIKKPTHNNGYN